MSVNLASKRLSMLRREQSSVSIGLHRSLQSPLQSPQSRGLALIEIVVALSLAALMLVAISSILGGLVRKNKEASKVVTSEWLHEMDQLLWNDLAQARSVAVSQGRLFLACSTPRAMANQRETQAVYHLQNDGYSSKLVRSFEGPNDNLKATSSQTIFWNVRQIQFERIDDSGAEQPLPTEPGPTPRTLKYTIWLTDGSTPFERKITVR